MRPNIENGKAHGFKTVNGLRYGHSVDTLAGNINLDADSPTMQVLDPGGAGRTITLPAEADSDGLCFIIVNTADAPEDLTVNDDAAGGVVTVSQNEMAVVVCDGAAWHGMVGGIT